MYHGLTNLISSATTYCSTPPHLRLVILFVPQYYSLTIPSNTSSDHQLKSSLTSAFLILSFFYHVEYRAFSNLLHLVLQGDQKVSIHLMITIQKVTSNIQSVPRQSPDIY